jgi:hypothetical protein
MLARQRVVFYVRRRSSGGALFRVVYRDVRRAADRAAGANNVQIFQGTDALPF